MSLFKGKECVYCHKPFEENDDVVVCPECGAPHHRKCYQDNGKCALEHLHGTNEEWDKKNKLNYTSEETTNNNKEKNKKQSNSEISNEPINIDEMDMNKFSMYGFMDENEEIDDVSAKELATFVGKGSYYYLTKFKRIKEGSKLSWNFSAFIFNFMYFFYRKLYKQGLVLLIISVITAIPTLALVDNYAEFLAEKSKEEIITMNSAAKFANELIENADNPKYEKVIFWMELSNIAIFINFAVRLAAAFGANNIYMKHCIKKIKYTRAALQNYSENPNYPVSLRAIGGVSLQKALIITICYELLQMAVGFIIVSRHIV